MASLRRCCSFALLFLSGPCNNGFPPLEPIRSFQDKVVFFRPILLALIPFPWLSLYSSLIECICTKIVQYSLLKRHTNNKLSRTKILCGKQYNNLKCCAITLCVHGYGLVTHTLACAIHWSKFATEVTWVFGVPLNLAETSIMPAPSKKSLRAISPLKNNGNIYLASFEKCTINGEYVTLLGYIYLTGTWYRYQ